MNKDNDMNMVQNGVLTFVLFGPPQPEQLQPDDVSRHPKWIEAPHRKRPGNALAIQFNRQGAVSDVCQILAGFLTETGRGAHSIRLSIISSATSLVRCSVCTQVLPHFLGRPVFRKPPAYSMDNHFRGFCWIHVQAIHAPLRTATTPSCPRKR